jgi:hypothetical protein
MDSTSDQTTSTDVRSAQFASPTATKEEFTDGRRQWDWETKYPKDARSCINTEACCLSIALLALLALDGLAIGLSGQTMHFDLLNLTASSASSGVPNSEQIVLEINFRLIAIFFTGAVGGTTFSIKWLIHAVAKGKWHLDRRHWRLFVPAIGGVYACVVLTLFDAGLIGSTQPAAPRPMATAAALAFLVGYFSDGVSGLLSNIANAVFGTLKK